MSRGHSTHSTPTVKPIRCTPQYVYVNYFTIGTTSIRFTPIEGMKFQKYQGPSSIKFCSHEVSLDLRPT